MLEGEANHVILSPKFKLARVVRLSNQLFRHYDPDPAIVVSGVPGALHEYALIKGRELQQWFPLARLTVVICDRSFLVHWKMSVLRRMCK